MSAKTPFPFIAGDLLIPLDDSIERQSTIRVLEFGELRFVKSYGEIETILDVPPAANAVFVRPRRKTAPFVKMRKLESILSATLGSSQNGMEFNKIQELLIKKSFEKHFIDGVIRTLISVGWLLVSRGDNERTIIRLSRDAR